MLPYKLKRILLALISFALTLCFSIASAQSIDPPSRSLLQKGLELYQRDRFTESIQLYQQAIADYLKRQDPLSEALAQRYLALAYQELGQWQQAASAIDRSLKLLQAIPKQDSTYFEILAKVLNTQGRHQFQTGQVEAALLTWKQATLNYQKAGQQAGVISSLTNQAIALQALGFSVQARTTLTAVHQSLQTNTSLKAEGLSHLGEALRRLGAHNQSRQVLQESLSATTDPVTRSRIFLELGNTERAIAQQSLAISKVEDASKQAQTALDYYQRSLQLATSNSAKLQAQLNAFSLLAETHQNELAMQQWRSLQPLLTNLRSNRTNIYAQLNATQTLMRLKRNRQSESALPAESEIAQRLVAVYQQARTLQDPRTESYALGQLGELYESTQQWSDAQQLTLQAIARLEGLQASDMRYRWEWQLGRLMKQQGNQEQAIAAYTKAISSLQSVRENLLLTNPDVQFSFRDRVEPIYRGLTALLLQSSSTPTQNQLQSAIATIDSLQLAELENFLRCDLSQLASLSQDLDQLDPRAAFVYPIILSDRIEVIVRLPEQPLKRYTTMIAQDRVERTLQDLRRAILRNNASRVIEHAKQVYSWLIEPLEADLTQRNAIETLVFVLDGSLRNVPMSALYDAKTNQYLVEKPYAIALLPTSQLFDLQTQPQLTTVLGAGISKSLKVGNRRFNALNATAELESVRAIAKHETLLDLEFTQQKLQEKLRSQGFSIVHLVTHGHFSSDPEETYLLVHSSTTPTGELLKPNDLTLLLQPNDLTVNRPIDLLILSACKTAEGDNRATLGLVGLAVRAGARSTLGTLWQVSDESTIALMNQFYEELKQPSVSKAEALHRAQLSLLQTAKYQNPYHWSPYILVGNWL